MKRNLKAIVCVILLAAMLIPLLSACNANKAPDGYKHCGKKNDANNCL